jgi:hypothetical protein
MVSREEKKMKCLHLDNKGKTEESHKQLGWVPIRKTMHTDTCHAEIKHCKNSFPQEKKTLRRNPKTVYAVLQEQHKTQTIWMIVIKYQRKGPFLLIKAIRGRKVRELSEKESWKVHWETDH